MFQKRESPTKRDKIKSRIKHVQYLHQNYNNFNYNNIENDARCKFGVGAILRDLSICTHCEGAFDICDMVLFKWAIASAAMHLDNFF